MHARDRLILRWRWHGAGGSARCVLGADRYRLVAITDAGDDDIGRFLLEQAPDGMVVDDLLIAPGWRRRGIGTSLMRHLADVHEALACDLLALPARLAEDPQPRAVADLEAWYRGLGFVDRVDHSCLVRRALDPAKARQRLAALETARSRG